LYFKHYINKQKAFSSARAANIVRVMSTPWRDTAATVCYRI